MAETDTGAAPAVTGLDVTAVSAWIDRLGIGAEPPLHFTRIGRGKSNLTFAVRDGAGRTWVLRRPPLGQLLASAHDVAREHRVLSALAGTAVPAPGVVGFCDDGATCDVPLLLMEYVDGVVIDSEEAAVAVPEERRHAIGLSLAATLGSIHGVDLEATGLRDLASHKPYAARQLKRWARQWEQSKTRELPAVEELAGRLERAAPEQTELTLVHGDYHILNVISDPEDGHIRAVLDWELCTLGEPLADLGGLLAYWPEATDSVVGSNRIPTLPGFPKRRELAAAYAEATGRDLSALPFWQTLAYWKIAIIIEGVRRRVLDEPQNAGPGELVPAHVVDNMITRALETAEAAGI